ncbi:MAG TPA: patatin-like phospholipase family protein [Ohtaekwangia sp.]
MKTAALLLVILGSITISYGQSCRKLVLEGAGIRGIAYVGAIKQLEEQDLLKGIEKVGGTSAGAIAALTIALGYSSGEIEDIIYKTKLQKFNDGRFIFFGGISRMNRNYGWYRGDAFISWLEKVIANKTNHPDITFRELHERKFKDLYVTGTSLNKQKLIVFSYETYPDMKVKDAVRISMSIPLYFEAVFIDASGKVLDKKSATGDFDIMVDGGLTGNFPIHIFDSLTVIDNRQVRIPDLTTIGIRVDTPEQIGYDSLHKGLAPIPIDRFRGYVSAFYNYAIENLNRNQLTDKDWKRTVSISSGDIGPKIRKLSVQEKDFLIRNGYQATADFLHKSRQLP